MKIKYPAVIVATIVHYILGGLWYSPLLFGNKFLQYINWTPEQLKVIESQSHAKELVIAFIMSFVLVFVLAHFVNHTNATNAVGGIQTGFWLWLGFVVTTQLPTVIFEGRSLGLYLLNVGYQLVGCMLAGAILAVWRTKEATDAVAQTA
jgi:glycerol uptake facilitator-like aquaporin